MFELAEHRVGYGCELGRVHSTSSEHDTCSCCSRSTHELDRVVGTPHDQDVAVTELFGEFVDTDVLGQRNRNR